MESENKCLLECLQFRLLEADFPPCVDVAKLHVVAVDCMERFDIPSSVRIFRVRCKLRGDSENQVPLCLVTIVADAILSAKVKFLSCRLYVLAVSIDAGGRQI